jgi:nitrite reductase/ring-hydroxylating ferredoxin subunit
MVGLDDHLVICAGAELVNGGKGHRFSIEQDGEKIPAFVIRFKDKVHGYVNRCSHQAFELDWNPGEFFDLDSRFLMCSTHGALFNPDNGQCVFGRCNGIGLKKLDIHEAGGKVYLQNRTKVGTSR